MQISDVSIRRPVFAAVLSLLLCVGGLAALMGMPVREVPQVDNPVVSVATAYRGASNEVIDNRVTDVIERAVAGIEGITEIRSVSRNDLSQVTVEFQISRDPDAAAADVRDRVSRVIARLPDGVDPPVVARVDANAQAIYWIGITSDTMDALELTDFLRRNVIDRLATVPGVANINVGGERRYALRIAIDRQALAARGLTVQDVESAIRRQNVDIPGGRLTSSQRELTVKTDSKLSRPAEFEAIVVSNRNGYQVRLGEVARATVAPRTNASSSTPPAAPPSASASSGRPPPTRCRSPTACAPSWRRCRAAGASPGRAASSARLQGEVPLHRHQGVPAPGSPESELGPSLFPPGMNVQVLFSEANFIQSSINGVLLTLFEGIILVIMVILIFLRSWRSTVVAAIAIPVSIIPTFAVLWACGFSINTLTLLAMVLAIGIVVDDAIVEVENVHRASRRESRRCSPPTSARARSPSRSSPPRSR